MVKNGLPPVFSCTSRTSGLRELGLAANGVRNQLFEIFIGQRRQYDIAHGRARPADRIELAHERVRTR